MDKTVMQYLETINPTIFDKQIKFYDFYKVPESKTNEIKEHVYLIEDKEIYDYSVTTFVHSYFPHFNANIIINGILKSRKWKTDESYQYYQKTKEEIKAMWDANGKEATTLGTAMHERIEIFYNEVMMNSETNVPNETPELRQFANFHTEGPLQFRWVPWRTELRIYDEDLKIAGSVDMLYKSPKSTEKQTYLIMIDWKRSKEITKTSPYGKYANPPIQDLPDTNYHKYSLQLNVYKRLIEKHTPYIIEYMALGVFHPNQTAYQLIPVEPMASHVDKLFQARIDQLRKTTANKV